MRYKSYLDVARLRRTRHEPPPAALSRRERRRRRDNKRLFLVIIAAATALGIAAFIGSYRVPVHHGGQRVAESRR
jgi:hypothetical protein